MEVLNPPTIWTPNPVLPLITLRSAAELPPMTLLVAVLLTSMPMLFGTATLPDVSVPMKFPAIDAPRELRRMARMKLPRATLRTLPPEASNTSPSIELAALATMATLITALSGWPKAFVFGDEPGMLPSMAIFGIVIAGSAPAAVLTMYVPGAEKEIVQPLLAQGPSGLFACRIASRSEPGT